MEGWIKIHRSILKWEWYNDINVFRLFIHLLLTANYESKKWRGMRIKRGQLVTSVANLGKFTGLSMQSVRSAKNKLKSTGEITYKTTSNYTIITICNYDYYQDIELLFNKPTNKPINKVSTRRQQGINKASTTTKEYKKEKNIRMKEEKKIDTDVFIDNSNQILFKKWQEWCDFRRLLKKPYRTTPGAAAAYNKLLRLADRNSETAIDIINQSIENEWIGLFPLKISEKGNKNVLPGEGPVDRLIREQKEYFASSKKAQVPHDSKIDDMIADMEIENMIENGIEK